MKDGEFNRVVLDTNSFESDGIQFILDIVVVSCKSYDSTISTIIVDLKSDFVTTSFPMYYNENATCFEAMRDIINQTPKQDKQEFKKLVNDKLKESYIERKKNCFLL